MVEVVVTGFGPFPGQPANPTESIVAALADDPRVRAEVLPVSWTRAIDRLEQLADENEAAAVVAFGVAAAADVVRIEAWAHNLDQSDRPDVDGETRGGTPIDPDGPARLATRLPVQELIEALQDAAIPVELSDNAGGYVCNHLFHQMLDRLELDRVVGFVHVPDVGTGRFTEEVLVAVGRQVVDVLTAPTRSPS